MLPRWLIWIMLAALAWPAAAQEAYPAKPVRFVVPFPAGGPLDVLARLYAQKLSERWGKPAIVENRAGATGTIGVDAVVKSPPDGYTLLFTVDLPIVMAPALFKPPYDPKRDLIPVAGVSENMNMLVVHPSTGVQSLVELVRGGDSNRLDLHAERFRRSLDVAQQLLARGIAGVEQDDEARQGRERLLHQLDPLPGSLTRGQVHPGHVAPGPASTFDEPHRHEVAIAGRAHDRDSAGRPMRRDDGLARNRDDRLDAQLDEVLGERRQSIELAVGVPIFEQDGVARPPP